MDNLQAEAELALLLESKNFSKKDFLLGKKLPQKDAEKINLLIEKRVKERIPMQHIVGYSYFMGEKFLVNEHVLIPRPETELLVEEISKIQGKTLLDIGTGSGCIAIMCKKITGIKTIACDISEKALEIARKNAENLNVEIEFVQSDLFENITGKFNIIASNPPYIPLSQMPKMTPEVAKKEPHHALFTKDEKGIEFYEKIISQSSDYLKKDGFLVFELGINQAKIVCELLKNKGFDNINMIKDLSGIERIIIAQKI